MVALKQYYAVFVPTRTLKVAIKLSFATNEDKCGPLPSIWSFSLLPQMPKVVSLLKHCMLIDNA